MTFHREKNNIMRKYHNVELQKKIEALLFATDDPIGIREMASLLMENEENVRKELKKLMKDYSIRDTSITISSSGKRYRMSLKPGYESIAMPVAKMEMSPLQLKALTVIYNSNRALRGNIREKLGEKADDIISELKRSGFIKIEKYRNTEKYVLTKKFYSYFSVNQKKLKEEINKAQEGVSDES